MPTQLTIMVVINVSNNSDDSGGDHDSNKIIELGHDNNGILIVLRVHLY